MKKSFRGIAPLLISLILIFFVIAATLDTGENTELTYEQELSDAAKRQAMQLILDNGDQFEPDVVDEALNDLNSQMYDPLIPQYEMDELLEKEDNQIDNTETEDKKE